MRLSPNLVSMPLCAKMMTSRDPISLPLSVLRSMHKLGQGHTVDGLPPLANRALAGQSTGFDSLSEISSAIDAINIGFDECAVRKDCFHVSRTRIENTRALRCTAVRALV